MRAGPNHPVYDAYPNQMEEIRKSFGFKSDADIQDAIDILETWVQQQNHFTVRDFGRDYLESYLIGAKGSIEKAKQRIDKRCTLRNLVPEFFENIQPKTDFSNLLKHVLHVPMPLCTNNYYRICIDKFYGTMEDFSLLDYARFVTLNMEYSMLNDYALGFEGVLDLSEVALSDVVSKLNPVVLQKIMIMIQEGYGCKVKAIHIIYNSNFVQTVVALFKQGLSAKMGNRIQVHNTFETLHKFIDKTCLPLDYGGTGPSMQEIHGKVYKQMCSEEHVARMKIIDTYATDESKRLSSKFNEEYMGMPGSFRTLSVD